MIRRYSRLTSSLLGGLLAMFLVAILPGGGERMLEPMRNPIELMLLDLRFRMRPAPHATAPVTVVVLRSAPDLPATRTLRAELADLLERLAALDAVRRPRAVVVDVLLALEEPPPLEGPTAAARVIDASRSLGTVVHPVVMAFRDEPRDAATGADGLELHTLAAGPGWTLPIPIAAGLTRAHPSIAPALHGAAAALGFANLSPRQTPGYAMLRTVPLMAGYRLDPGIEGSDAGAPAEATTASTKGAGDLRLVPSLALAGARVALCGAGSLPRCLSSSPDGLRIGGGPSLPLDEQGELWINFRDRFRYPDLEGRDRPAGLPDLLLFQHGERDGSLSGLDGGAISAGDLDLSGQALVVVDARETASGRTPLGEGHPPWTVHAQALANLLEQDFLAVVPGSLAWVAALALLGLAGLLQMRGWMRVPEPALAVLWIGAAGITFLVSSAWWPVALPVAGLAGSLAGRQLALPRQLRRLSKEMDTLRQKEQWLVEDLGHWMAERDRIQEALEQAHAEADRERGSRAGIEAALKSITEGHHAVDQVTDAALGVVREVVPVASSPAAGEQDVRRLIDRLQEVQSRVAERLDEHRDMRERMARTAADARSEVAWLEASHRLYQGRLQHTQALLDEVSRVLERLNPAVPPGLQHDPELEQRTGFITRDPALITKLRVLIDRIAPTDLRVLIRGESGTGKEVVAEAIHRNSTRRARRLVTLNCSAVPAGLLESELFGAVKGAYTGAVQDREGVFVQADGGTLFLDELGTMPLEMQVRLLRVLEKGEVVPVGGNYAAPRRVDVRIIAATNEDLEALIAEGKFRQDLFYRLRNTLIVLPPLRARRGDIEPLARHFLEEGHRRAGRPGAAPVLAPEASRLLQRYDWPGNVREMRGTLESIAALARGAVISAAEVEAQLEQLRSPGLETPSSVPPRPASTAQENRGEDRPAAGRKAPPVSPDLEPSAEQEGGQTASTEPADRAGPAVSPMVQDGAAGPFTGRELELLALLRQHRFNVRSWAADPAYGVNRTTAYFHLWILMSRALEAGGWRIDQATHLLAGGEAALHDKVRHHLETFLENLTRRLERSGDWPAFEQAIRHQFRGNAPLVLEVVRRRKDEGMSSAGPSSLYSPES